MSVRLLSTYFLPISISHHNTINHRRLPCLSMSIFRANCIYLQSYVEMLKIISVVKNYLETSHKSEKIPNIYN